MLSFDDIKIAWVTHEKDNQNWNIFISFLPMVEEFE